jgi:hypothetical protein
MADAIGLGRRACRREDWAMEVAAAGQQDRHCKYRIAMMGEPTYAPRHGTRALGTEQHHTGAH